MSKSLLPVFVLVLALLAACTRACPIASCHIRKVHLHSKKQYRGQPIWKKQNPRIGEKMGRKNARDNQETQQKQRKGKK